MNSYPDKNKHGKLARIVFLSEESDPINDVVYVEFENGKITHFMLEVLQKTDRVFKYKDLFAQQESENHFIRVIKRRRDQEKEVA